MRRRIAGALAPEPASGNGGRRNGTCELRRKFGAAADILHDAQMHGAKNVMRPEVEIPERPNMEGVPGAADESRCAIRVFPQHELAAMRTQVADQFGIRRRLSDLKREPLVRNEIQNLLFEDGAATEDALTVPTHRICRRRGRFRIRQSKTKEPEASI